MLTAGEVLNNNSRENDIVFDTVSSELIIIFLARDLLQMKVVSLLCLLIRSLM